MPSSSEDESSMSTKVKARAAAKRTRRATTPVMIFARSEAPIIEA